MKRIVLTALAAVAAIGITADLAAATSVTAATSKHNLSSSGPSTTYRSSSGEVCIFCHTPHNARVVSTGTGNQLPLWNRNAPTQTNYGIYQSATMNAVPTSWGGGDNSSSALCMGCHDGTIGVGSIIVKPGDVPGSQTNAAVLITGNANLGSSTTALSNDHPVNFIYNTALANADGGLRDPATNTSVSNLLFAGSVQCGSCHDVHDNTNAPFLRMSNSGSALCITCHTK